MAPLRVFLSHVDTYTEGRVGRVIHDVLNRPTEEEEEEQEEDEEGKKKIRRPTESKVDIVGTFRKEDSVKPKWCSEVIPSDYSQEYVDGLLSCDVIICNIFDGYIDDATFAVQTLASENYVGEKVFILLSTAMTWVRTDKDEEEDPEFAFTEDDFRRRKPHNSYRDHWQCEKLVSKLRRKDKLNTYVMWMGLAYGEQEELFHSNFRHAWELDAEGVSSYGEGSNFLPLIHVCDIASAVAALVQLKPETRYYIAVDDGKHTQMEVCDALNTKLGTGQSVKIMSRDEMLLSDNTELFQINLRLNNGAIKELGFEWRAETGMLENMDRVVEEYKQSRNLTSLKVFLHGPPASGKSYLAAQLADQYNVPHLKLGEIIKEVQESQSALQEEVLEAPKDKEGKYADDILVKMVRHKLLTKVCLNRGFILDGFPKTQDQAKALFTRQPAEEGEEEPEPEEDEGEDPVDKRIMPEFVITLSGTDAFIQGRVKELPEETVKGTTWVEAALNARLTKFRAINTEDKTVLKYFVQKGNEYCEYDAEDNQTGLGDKLKVLLGPPHNYGPSPEEIAEKLRIQNEQEAAQRETERARQSELEQEEKEHRLQAERIAADRLAFIDAQEKELLTAKALPLRNYLMENIMPTLMESLISVCKVKPEDPVDYVAEYLFREDAPRKNPEAAEDEDVPQ